MDHQGARRPDERTWYPIPGKEQDVLAHVPDAVEAEGNAYTDLSALVYGSAELVRKQQEVTTPTRTC